MITMIFGITVFLLGAFTLIKTLITKESSLFVQSCWIIIAMLWILDALIKERMEKKKQ